MDSEPNRLARGYVREEMRRHLKSTAQHDSITHYINKSMLLTAQSLQKRKQLTQIETLHTRNGLLQKIKTQLNPIAQASFQRNKDILHSFAFWRFDELEMTENDRQYYERGYLLHTITLGVQRTKLEWQYSCARLYVREHALYRMIDRGLFVKEPLKQLTPYVDKILGLSIFMLMVKNKHDIDGDNILIPIEQGMLLGSIGGLTANAGNLHHRMVLSKKKEERCIGSDLSSDADAEITIDMINIDTYIAKHQMSIAQYWVQDQLNKLTEQFPNVIAFAQRVTQYTAEQTNPLGFAQDLKKAEETLLDILNSHHWKVASGG